MLKTQLILTAVLVVAVAAAMIVTRIFVKRFSVLRSLGPNRRKLVHNLYLFMIYIVASVLMALIWGVNFEDFAVFMSSVLAVLGVAFFAQWSILSNLTASVILFYNHPLRIGDRIRIIDKDYDWVGEVENISGFYLFMRTDSGRRITIPTNLVLQKGIELKPKTSEAEQEQKLLEEHQD